MTKYSGEIMNDDYEPEEGEIQDDDETVEEVALSAARAINESQLSDSRSDRSLTCRRDEPKLSQRKSASNMYGGKTYFVPDVSGAFTLSQSSSRTRFRSSEESKWYRSRRQSSSLSKEWDSWKSPGGAKDRERLSRDSKRASRSQYYSSFFSTSQDQRSLPRFLSSGSTHFSSSVPPWCWYSKDVKRRNKKQSTSSDKCTDILKEVPATNISQNSNLKSQVNTETNAEKITVEYCNSQEMKEQTNSCPNSPSSSKSIEIIEVPPKVPELITIYDSDEEPSKISSKPEISRDNGEVVNDQTFKHALEISLKPCPVRDTALQSSRNKHYKSDSIQENSAKDQEDMHYHLQTLTLAMKKMCNEREKYKMNLQQKNNVQEYKSKTVNFSVPGETEENNSPNAKENAAEILRDLNSLAAATNDKSASQIKFDSNIEKINNTKQCNDRSGNNAEKYVNLNHQTDVSFDRFTEKNCDISHNSVQQTPGFTCDSALQLLSSSSSQLQSNSLEHAIDDKCSAMNVPGDGQSQVAIFSATSIGNLENNEENDSFPTVSNKQMNELSIPSSTCSVKVSRSGERIHLTHCTDSKSYNNNYMLSISEHERTDISCTYNKNESDLKNDQKFIETEDNLLDINSYSLNDKEENTKKINQSTVCNIRKEEHLGELHPEINNNIDISQNNVIQIESPKSSVIDGTQNNASNTLSHSVNNTAIEIIENKSKNDLLCALSQNCTKGIQSEENITSVCNTEPEKNILKRNFFSEPIEAIKASSVAVLKQRAMKLKAQLKLKQNKSIQESRANNNSSMTMKCENQKLVPSVVIHNLMKNMSCAATSKPVDIRPLHKNNQKNPLLGKQVPTAISTSGNSSDSSKYFKYSSSALIYEDRKGSKIDESENFREPIIKRVNITVPELIINLGKESDSGDDSDKSDKMYTVESDIQKSDTEQRNNIPTSQTISTDFEKKLDVLLKQARFQQESNTSSNEGNKNDDNLPSFTFSQSQEESYVPASCTSFNQKNIQTVHASQGCARVIPSSSVKKMASTKVGKSKVSKMKSVVIKNTSLNANCDRTAKLSISTNVSNNKPSTKEWNRSIASRGKPTSQAASMGDIGLLPPLKQKEYLKLRRQLLQMSQKKKDNQTKEKSETINHPHKNTAKNEKKSMETVIKTTETDSNKQASVGESFISCEGNRSHSQGMSVTIPQKILDQDFYIANLQTSLGDDINEHQVDNENNSDQIGPSEHCDNHVLKESMNKEEKIILIHNSNHFSPIINVNEDFIMSESFTISKPKNSNISISSEKSDTHQSNSSNALDGNLQVVKLNIDHSCTVTTNSSKGMKSGKRKVGAVEESQKKQKTASRESTMLVSQFQDIATETSSISDQSKLLEDLRSSETKLIAKRCQVLEDISTVRLNVYKIEAAIFRKDQIIQKINKLKMSLKQAEESLTQEEECLRNLNTRINDSRQNIQKGQSELLSLSLECEELGCKVHGPPNYNVPKTCVDLIRSEMLAMTEAMQELENQKNAM